MGGVGHKSRESPLSMKDLPREVLYEIALSSMEGSSGGATWLKRQTLHSSPKETQLSPMSKEEALCGQALQRP